GNQSESVEGSGGDGGAGPRSGETGRPVCLPLPSTPRLPSKRTIKSSCVDDTAAQFEAKCTVGSGRTTNKAVPSRGMADMVAAALEATAVRLPSWDKSTPADLEARERTAQVWIEAVSGKPCVAYETRQFARNLKSGEILCALVNAIRPGTIPVVHEGQLGFNQMENVDNFLSACCKLGVPAHALVDTADVFEMRDTAKLVECVHALGSVVQVTCPGFRGPHLGLAADPSLATTPAAAAILPDAQHATTKPTQQCPGAHAFTRACTRTHAYPAPPRDDGNGKAGTGDEPLVLNMQDVKRPRSTRRGFTTTVGSITDLEPPATLSARARLMCPEEMVNSPRALVFNADRIAHPARSPTLRAAWESDANNGRGRSAWGTDSYPRVYAPRDPRLTLCVRHTPSGLSATSLPRGQNLSPAGPWGTGGGNSSPETPGGGVAWAGARLGGAAAGKSAIS
ncbi:unnamed protein product, partial [Scytosiphon promiscuus]